MKIKKSVEIQILILAIVMIYSIFMAAHLPDTVVTHWNASGQPDGYGSKWLNLLLMPGVIVFMIVLTVALPKLSPEKFEIEPFENTYSVIMIVLAGMMGALHFVIVGLSGGAHWDVNKAMLGVIFASFMVLGNFMAKIKPNFYMGIRTPWTLSDERVWQQTHRSAAKLWAFGSALGLILVLIGVPFWISFSYMMAICLWPVVDSYRIYRRLHPKA